MSRVVEKAARLVALSEAKKAGWLKTHTQQEIADAMGLAGRWVICRYMHDLRDFEKTRSTCLVRLKNLKK